MNVLQQANAERVRVAYGAAHPPCDPPDSDDDDDSFDDGLDDSEAITDDLPLTIPDTADEPGEPVGAIDVKRCPLWGRHGGCKCGLCEVCGNQKHTAIHGPLMGEPEGSKPWGHAFQPVGGMK